MENKEISRITNIAVKRMERLHKKGITIDPMGVSVVAWGNKIVLSNSISVSVCAIAALAVGIPSVQQSWYTGWENIKISVARKYGLQLPEVEAIEDAFMGRQGSYSYLEASEIGKRLRKISIKRGWLPDYYSL